jgi:hypothetical protein
MRILIPVVLSAFVFAACEKEADIKLPDTKPKLSISCFISDSTEIIKASIYWSKPVFNKTDTLPEYPNNLMVIISGNGQLDTMLYNSEWSTYEVSTVDFPLNAGVEYTLQVTAPNGETARAKTIIPNEKALVSDKSVSFTSSVDQYNNIIETYRYRITLNDISPNMEFYRIMYYNKYFIPDVPDELNLPSNVGELFVSDNNMVDGKIFTDNEVKFYGVSANISSRYAYVIRGSEEYYRFHKSLSNYGYDNPFAEPTIVYTNVDNGLGVFAGYNQVRVDF